MKALKYFIVILFGYLAFSCQQLPEEGDWTSDEANKTLKVEVRSAGEAAIEYPLYLYAFTDKGKLAASQIIENAEKEMSLPLSKGDFQVVGRFVIKKQ